MGRLAIAQTYRAADDCKTAAEVRARAARAVALRRSPALPQPIPQIPASAKHLPRHKSSEREALEEMRFRYSVETIKEVGIAYFGISERDLIADQRHWPLVHQRQIIAYVAMKMTGRSLPFIGRHLCRDHTTLIQARRRVQRMLDDGCEATKIAVDDIIARLDDPTLPRMAPVLPMSAGRNGARACWTAPEVETLCRTYGDEKRPLAEVASLLGRSEDAVNSKVIKLRLSGNADHRRRLINCLTTFPWRLWEKRLRELSEEHGLDDIAAILTVESGRRVDTHMVQSKLKRLGGADRRKGRS